MTEIREYMKERNWFVAIVLLLFGFIFLWLCMHYDKSSERYTLLMNLGTAFIVTAVAMLILTYTVKGIETTLDNVLNEIVSKLDILGEAQKCEIVHIFESRRLDKNFKKELIEQFKKVGKCEEVLLMSNSLRDFFGPKSEEEIEPIIFDMLKRGINFRILLLDPLSKAAKARAFVEEKEKVEKRGYINSMLFNEITDVADWLYEPSGVSDDDLKRRIKEQIEVRFSPYDPATQIIRTDKYTFIEQYHRGGDKGIRKTLAAKGFPHITCFGGFVPVLMIKNTSRYARLMKSHFVHIWDSPDLKTELEKKEYYLKKLSSEES